MGSNSHWYRDDVHVLTENVNVSTGHMSGTGALSLSATRTEDYYHIDAMSIPESSA